MRSVIFQGGRVFTADPSRPFAEAVLVSGGRIAAVGGAAEVTRAAPARTETVDLDGGLLIPGFTDAHIHPVQAGLERSRCDLAEDYGVDAYLSRIRRYADAHPDRSWIDGGGWDMSAFPGGLPHRSQLDAVVPDRPVYLIQRDHHAAWVNTRALELAGIDAGTPDPADGRIERDPDGTPSGVLHEGAMDLVGLLTPRPTRADAEAALMDAQRHLFSLGVTGWQDAIVGSYAGSDDQLPVYLAAAESGRLRARVVGALWWDRARGAEQIEELEHRRSLAPAGGRFQATSVKIMQDGIPENFTAGMIEPYCECAPPNTGLSYVDPAELRSHVTELDRRGFQVHFHAIGDRAVRESLDALQAARDAGGTGEARHHIAHVQIIHPDDVPRFAALGVAANIQPLWATHHAQMDELCIPFLGPERTAWQYPFADLLRHGTHLAAGSDWPVSSADPIQGIHVAVNRTEPAGSVHASYPTAAVPFLPGQRLELATALTAYTAGSAWLNRSPAGVIAAGRPADLAVLDRDLFELDPAEICTAKVSMTFVDGEPV
ncbi:amidohydrolase [Rhizohabitans arisaemae]|uniref:amidohydrolase n=1 Tax=Rhizohabitans arisaemae TaxID=2720610 RepID=UPI0024B1088E|nr:amidohydrolase [Rhizohabitans arisaemae]